MWTGRVVRIYTYISLNHSYFLCPWDWLDDTPELAKALEAFIDRGSHNRRLCSTCYVYDNDLSNRCWKLYRNWVNIGGLE